MAGIRHVGMAMGVASMIGWAMLLPLKEIRAVPFSIDPDTKLPVLLTEKVEELEPSEAMAFREVANYVRDRETYDVQDNNERLKSVLSRSDELAEASYRELWDGSNEEPSRRNLYAQDKGADQNSGCVASQR